MRVLVTGGAGFIGANLCTRLAATDAVSHVVALDDLSTGTRENLAGVDVELIQGSILDAPLIERAVSSVDAIVHLAACPSVPQSLTDPMNTHLTNATGTMNVLEAARRAGNLHTIVASSSAVYGASPMLPKREDLATVPISPYGASKLATEGYALAYLHSFELPVLAFRFFNVFGPLQPADHAYAAVVPAFLDAALSGRPLVVYGDGRQTRDFTFVDSVTSVLEAALVRATTRPTPVNLAFGTSTDLLELIQLLERQLDRELPVEHEAPRLGDVRHSHADSSLLRELFPDIEPVDIEPAIAATLDWFRSALYPEG